MLDVDDSIISSINAIGGYDLYLINHNYQKVFIDQVSAINSLKDTQGAIDAIKDADIITTAVLATNLEKIAPILSKGLKARLQLRKAKINILACENLENNSGVLRKKVLALGEIKENDLESIAAFPDTEVDRLVLKSERNGEPAIDIGDEFELVVDKTKLVNPGLNQLKMLFTRQISTNILNENSSSSILAIAGLDMLVMYTAIKLFKMFLQTSRCYAQREKP